MVNGIKVPVDNEFDHQTNSLKIKILFFEIKHEIEEIIPVKN